MARYTASGSIPPGCEGHDFIGWDDLETVSTEATREENLGMKMPKVFRENFLKLEPGEEIWVKTGRLFREF